MFKRFLIFIFVFTTVLLTAQDPLFEVKNDQGISIFSVTPTGLQIFGMSMEAEGDNIWISDTSGTPLMTLNGTGMSVNNSLGQQLMIAGSDSVRFYINDLLQDESRGGFAIGSVGARNVSNFLDLTPANYFIGHEAGASLSSGTYNQFIGYQAGTNNTTGNFNQFVGYQSGYTNTEGYDNLFFGYRSGYSNVHGNNNVFLGKQAGYSNTGNTVSSGGSNNIFIGEKSGYQNTLGFYNTYIGYYSGYSSGGLDTYRNVYMGAYSGYNFNGVVGNVCIGYNSGRYMEDGNYNTFVGNEAGQAGALGTSTFVTASGNSFFGSHAGHRTSGDYNSFFGYNAGQYNSSGGGNTFLGVSAGAGTSSNMLTGNNNVFLGYNSGKLNSGSGNVFIGYNSGSTLTSETNKLIIDNSNTTSPLIYGCFETDVVFINDAISLNPRESAPSYPTAGMMYFSSSSNKLMVYDGSTWQACW